MSGPVDRTLVGEHSDRDLKAEQILKADLHDRQDERIATLHRFEILDTPREPLFDELAEFAAAICDVPIAVVNLVDTDRQWFKAEIGLGVRETPLDTSICSHAILDTEFTEIEDTLDDARTADNPLCQAADGLRFYAGALLTAENGLPIGTFCVLDHKPNKLTEFQKRALTILANQVMRELKLRQNIRLQETLSREMDHRVKNSLQTVSSVLRIYKRYAGETAAKAFDAVLRRVDAIALLHQELHQAADSDTIPFNRYIENVCRLLQNSVPKNVRIETDIDNIKVGSKEASAVAVIVNEFVANSIKHAFPDGRQGKIWFSAHLLEDGNILFECQDDGVGSNARQDAVQDGGPSGLGLKIVEASVAQLGAKLVREARPDGYFLSINFPAPH